MKPFEANHRSSAALRLAALDTALSELIYLLTGDSRLRQPNAVFHRYPNPRIGYISVELVRVEPVNDAPRLSTQRHNLFCRAEPLAIYPHCQPVMRSPWSSISAITGSATLALDVKSRAFLSPKAPAGMSLSARQTSPAVS